MVFLSSSKMWVPAALFSAVSFHLELGSTGRDPNVFKYLCPELPRGTVRADGCQEQLPTTTPATTASLLLVCRWIGWSLERRKSLLHAPWKPQKNAFPMEPPSCFPSRLHLVFPLIQGGASSLPFRSCPRDRGNWNRVVRRRLLLMGWGYGF